MNLKGFCEIKGKNLERYTVYRGCNEVKTDANLSRRQIKHSISNLPSEPHQLFRSQISLRFHIRVFKVCVIEPTALSQISQQITVRHVLNKDKQRVYGQLKIKIMVHSEAHHRQYNLLRDARDIQLSQAKGQLLKSSTVKQNNKIDKKLF